MVAFCASSAKSAGDLRLQHDDVGIELTKSWRRLCKSVDITEDFPVGYLGRLALSVAGAT